MSDQQAATHSARDELLDVKAIAAILDTSERTAQRHIRAGKCGAYSEIGGKLRIRASVFWKAIERQEVSPRKRRT